MGLVEVGLVDSPSGQFQQLLLNVVGVRVNPSPDLTLSILDPNWRTVTVAPGPGGLGELQVDLNAIQNQVQVFNTGEIPAQEYQQVELALDDTLPGLITPNCPRGTATNEGCLSYPFQFKTVTVLRAAISLQVAANTLAPLVIDFNPGSITPPPAPGGVYTINPSITVPNPAPLLGAIHGTVTGLPSGGGTVTALLSGTSTIVASSPVLTGKYTIELPAQDAGTFFDLVLSGPGVSYAAAGPLKCCGAAVLPRTSGSSASRTAPSRAR